MISPQNNATIAARRLRASAVILCTLFLGFSIDTRAAQGAVGIVRATAQTPTTQEKTVTIPIEGMVWRLCVERVQKTLQGLEGVREVVVSLEQRFVRVRYMENAVSPERLVAAINHPGFKAGTPTGERTP